MNKHIKRLAKKAEDNDTFLYSYFDREKFALLIVQECIDILAPYLLRDGVQYRDPGRPLEHPILEIKEHFGIK